MRSELENGWTSDWRGHVDSILRSTYEEYTIYDEDELLDQAKGCELCHLCNLIFRRKFSENYCVFDIATTMNYFGAIGREACVIIINCFTLSLQYNRIVSELKTIRIIKS